MKLLAIDPGNTESAFLTYDTETMRPIEWAKAPNEDILHVLDRTGFRPELLAVEMIASYGMPVGREVFDTCVWVGRFIERWGGPHRRVYRREVKMHLCGTSKAKDGNVRQALIDRYGDSKEVAIGKKATPGPLYGISGDGWAALGVAVTAAETEPPAG